MANKRKSARRSNVARETPIRMLARVHRAVEAAICAVPDDESTPQALWALEDATRELIMGLPAYDGTDAAIQTQIMELLAGAGEPDGIHNSVSIRREILRANALASIHSVCAARLNRDQLDATAWALKPPALSRSAIESAPKAEHQGEHVETTIIVRGEG